MRHFSSVFPITFEVPGHLDERGVPYGEAVDIIRQFAFELTNYEKPAGQHWGVATDFGSNEASDQPEIVAMRVLVPKNSPPAWSNGPPVVFYDALEALVAVNIWCIRARMHGLIGSAGKSAYPSVYESVCYKPKVKGTEELWDSIEALHQRGHGVCEDLACARVAERRIVGDPCRPNLISQRMPDGILYHVTVQNPDGSNEDPSGELGMNLGKANDLTAPRCRLLLAKKA